MKTRNYNPFESWNTRREERRLQRERDASWRKLRRRQRMDSTTRRLTPPAFSKRNLHLLLIACAAIVVLWKGLTSATSGESSMVAMLCVILFVLLAILFRAAWRKDRFESYFKKRG
ncbi:MAG: hypothetical protein HDS43_03440 [Bacteroides sp.]|nr:hypothetical protein [Bacteroides sp.]